MRISVERSTSFLVELVRDRIPFSVRYDGDAIIVTDIGEGNPDWGIVMRPKVAGRKARANGEPKSSCPYKLGMAASSWHSGWNEADEELSHWGAKPSPPIRINGGGQRWTRKEK